MGNHMDITMVVIPPVGSSKAAYRYEPRTESKVGGCLPSGTTVRKLVSQGRWAKVLHEEVGEVWMKCANLQPVDKGNLQLVAGSQSGCASTQSGDAHPEVTESPPSWLDSLSNFVSAVADTTAAPCQTPQRLFPYQKEGVAFGVARQGRALLADETGLGKSVQALVIAAQFQEQWPLLVVAPTSRSTHWHRMAIEWLELQPESIQAIRNGSSSLLEGKKLIICSYDLLRGHEHLRRLPGGDHFQAIIFDESHWMKNAESARFLVAREMALRATRVLLLTSTPMPNAAAEIWAQLALLVPGSQLPTFEEFATRYSRRIESKFLGTLWKGYENFTELRERVLRHVMLQRQKVDVTPQLPTLCQNAVFLETADSSAKVEEAPEVEVIENEVRLEVNEVNMILESPDSMSADLEAHVSASSGGATSEFMQHAEAIVAASDLHKTTLRMFRVELERRLGLHEGALDDRSEEVANIVAEAVSKRRAIVESLE